jgi:hypothetical protein
MKKSLKILCLVVALIAVFVLGWRVMPKIWPGIKEAIVYPVFPNMKPTPAPTQEPYEPKGGYAFGDPILETDSVIYYFYKDYCPWCRQLEPLTSGLPKQILLPDGTKSDVKLVCLNKVEDRFLQIITEYYETYGIEEEKQYVPAMVIGDRYLFAGEEIMGQLYDAILQGEGLKTELLDGNTRK